MKYLATQISRGRTFEVTEEGKKAIENNPQLSNKYRFSPIQPKGKAPVEITEGKTSKKSKKEE